MRWNGERVNQVGFESLGNSAVLQMKSDGETLVVFGYAVFLDVDIDIQDVFVSVRFVVINVFQTLLKENSEVVSDITGDIGKSGTRVVRSGGLDREGDKLRGV